MSGQMAVPDVILLGDGSRYDLVCMLMNDVVPPEMESTPVWLQYGAAVDVRQHDGAIWLRTDSGLPNKTLYVPPEDSAKGPRVTQETMYLLFAGYPFANNLEHNLETVRALRVQRPETACAVVLMDHKPRQRASTDLDSPQEALDGAAAEYRLHGLPVLVVRSRQDILSVLHWHEALDLHWRRMAHEELKRMQDFLTTVEYDYQLLLEDWKNGGSDVRFLDEKQMDRICSYRSVIKAPDGFRETIWDCYTAAALGVLFPASGKGGSYSLRSLYDAFLGDLTFLGDPERDFSEIMQALRADLLVQVRAGRGNSGWFSPYTKAAYDRAVGEKGQRDFETIARFKTTLLDFVEYRLPSRFCALLQARLEILKGWLA